VPDCSALYTAALQSSAPPYIAHCRVQPHLTLHWTSVVALREKLLFNYNNGFLQREGCNSNHEATVSHPAVSEDVGCMLVLRTIQGPYSSPL